MVLVLGYFGCILAAYTHFTPIPFPENIYLIAFFVVVYGSISGFLQFIETFVERDRIFKSEKQKSGAYYELKSSLPLYENKYTISNCCYENGSYKVQTLSKCISNWFSEDGTFLELKFKQDFRENLLKN